MEHMSWSNGMAIFLLICVIAWLAGEFLHAGTVDDEEDTLAARKRRMEIRGWRCKWGGK